MLCVSPPSATANAPSRKSNALCSFSCLLLPYRLRCVFSDFDKHLVEGFNNKIELQWLALANYARSGTKNYDLFDEISKLSRSFTEPALTPGIEERKK